MKPQQNALKWAKSTCQAATPKKLFSLQTTNISILWLITITIVIIFLILWSKVLRRSVSYIFQIASFITITEQDELDVLKNALDDKEWYVIGLKNKANIEGPLVDIEDFKEGKNVDKSLPFM